MDAASLHDIKNEIANLDAGTLRGLCLSLAKFRKENKELLTYLLFESHDEQSYIASVKEAVDLQFSEVPVGANTYYVKKSLRKILRALNRQIRYSGRRETELELRLYYCARIREARIQLQPGTVLFNIYDQQLKKIRGIAAKLPEDLQADYDRSIQLASISIGPV